jgi:hypothetical protein
MGLDTYVWYVSHFDNLLFSFFGMICFVKTYILFRILISVCCRRQWWWSFNNYAVNCINCNSNIMSICRCYNNKERYSIFRCKYMSFGSLFASISWIISSHPPKGDFTDVLSRDCHDHLIPLLWSYIFKNLIQILSKVSDSLHSWNLLWHVKPQSYSFGNIFQ